MGFVNRSVVVGYLLMVAIVGLLSFSTVAIGASGKIVDQDGKPIEGVWVVYTREECKGYGHCNHFCVEVKIAKSDANGRYSFWSGFHSQEDYKLFFYYKGYQLEYRRSGSVIIDQYMKRGGQDDRFSKLDPVSGRIAAIVKTASEMSCDMAPKGEQEALIPVYKEMFAEARSIAVYPQHHEMAKDICRDIFWTQLDRSSSDPSQDSEKRQEQFLAKVEPSCNQPIDNSQEIALLAGVAKGDLAIIRKAASVGFDFNRVIDGKVPVVVAAENGHADMIAELVANGAKLDAAGADRKTALHHAIVAQRDSRSRRSAVVKALLGAGADPNGTIADGYPPIVYMATEARADVDMFELLIKYGARVDQGVQCRCGKSGYTVLHVVSDSELARIAIEHGANVNARSEFGLTPIMMDHPVDVIKTLVKHGADPNVTGQGSCTPLMYALRRYDSFPAGSNKQRNREIAETLVRSGAQIDARSLGGRAALLFTKDVELRKRLWDLGGRKNMQIDIGKDSDADKGFHLGYSVSSLGC